MSIAEVERFSKDLAENSPLQDKAKMHAAGLASIVRFAVEHGYDITIDDVKAFIRAKATTELSDDQLDDLAGGAKTLPFSAVNATVATFVSTAAQNTVGLTDHSIIEVSGPAVTSVVAGVVVLV